MSETKRTNRGQRPILHRGSLSARLEAEFPGFDPVIELARMSQDVATDASLKATCLKAVAPYVHPTLKSIEVKGIVGLGELADADLDALIKQLGRKR